MFLSLKQRAMMGVYVFIIVSIPIGAYLASEAQVFKSNASENKATPKPTSKLTTLTPAQTLLKNAEKKLLSPSQSPSSEPAADSSETTTATSFGPTLSLKTIIEGRKTAEYATKLFIGIVEGILSENPKFLLSFTVDLPASGEYSNLSLAGLSPGSKYTALLKGSAQIATSSAFTMSPAETRLNDNQPLTLLAGDLNEDNVVNSADLTILKSVLGLTSKSTSWNKNADYNLDGIINMFDLSILSNNIGKVGASGIWTSSIPQTASSSASLDESAKRASLTSPSSIGGSVNNTSDGYWIWIPK